MLRVQQLISVSLLALVLIQQPHSKQSVEQAMQEYNRLIRKQSADSIAMLFTPDGDLGNVAHGRDSIRKFLSGFKNITVLSQTSRSRTIDVMADTAIQTGSYQQADIVNAHDTVHVRGDFTATWLWKRDGGWKIKKMETTPVK